MSEIKAQFLSPRQARKQYDEIIPVYQAAFAGEPWYEVSKCDTCPTGYSRQEPGCECEVCGNPTGEAAYATKELFERFDMLGETRLTCWYTEREPNGELAFAAMAWRATVEQISEEKYEGAPEMADWLRERYPRKNKLAQALGGTVYDLLWLDEVFANRSVRTQGNLDNFRQMTEGFAINLSAAAIPLAYRTISPAMTRAAVRDYGAAATVERAGKTVPDWRDFVSIYPII